MSRNHPSLSIVERRYAMAHLSARRDDATLATRLRQSLGLTLPKGPSIEQAGQVRLLGISPGRWLALREEADHDFCTDLAALLRTGAAVCDVSDAYVVYGLRGMAVRALLAKLVAIDLHERAFSVGQVVATVVAHIPVILWRLQDEHAALFELAVPRSYAQSLREVLTEAGAEFGLISPS